MANKTKLDLSFYNGHASTGTIREMPDEQINEMRGEALRVITMAAKWQREGCHDAPTQIALFVQRLHATRQIADGRDDRYAKRETWELEYTLASTIDAISSVLLEVVEEATGRLAR